uniref:uncharacterized protein LOC122592159 n=1 Tax=Erigeron canadensis TaxID=72917 RepID=UPI001CB987C8|nr:uncharacterized protein LOC122592159 [Erigeron canadensis]
MEVHNRSMTGRVTRILFSPTSFRLIFFLMLLIVYCNQGVVGTKKRVHIPDDLHDVEDNEEDDEWKEWGRNKRMTVEEFDPPPENFSDMDFTRMQDEVTKRQVGTSYGFVKLRLDDHRTPDMVSDIAVKWTQLARTGAIEVTFMGFDITTVMFSLQNAQNILEVGFIPTEHLNYILWYSLDDSGITFKEFVLDQSEAYEIKMGERYFRRPGDPPYDDLLKELHKEKNKHATRAALPNETTTKTEL